MQDESLTDDLFKNVLLYVLYLAGMFVASFIIVQILIFIADVIGYAAQDIVIWVNDR